MNPPLDEKTIVENRSKRVLIVLFLLICLAGLTFGSLVVWGPADGPCKRLFSKAAVSVKKLTRSSTLLKRAGTGDAVTCRGVTLDVNNNALAIMDDQTLGIGQMHKGIKIIDITSSYVLVQYQGETRRLELGEKMILEAPEADQ